MTRGTDDERVPGTDDGSARPSDNALARRAGLGDRAAFEELFARLFPATLRYATRLLDGDERSAEDAVQDAWITAWRALPDFEGRSKVQTWLFTIVQREVYRRRRRTRPLAVDDRILEPLGRDDADRHQAERDHEVQEPANHPSSLASPGVRAVAPRHPGSATSVTSPVTAARQPNTSRLTFCQPQRRKVASVAP